MTYALLKGDAGKELGLELWQRRPRRILTQGRTALPTDTTLREDVVANIVAQLFSASPKAVPPFTRRGLVLLPPLDLSDGTDVDPNLVMTSIAIAVGERSQLIPTTTGDVQLILDGERLSEVLIGTSTRAATRGLRAAADWSYLIHASVARIDRSYHVTLTLHDREMGLPVARGHAVGAAEEIDLVARMATARLLGGPIPVVIAPGAERGLQRHLAELSTEVERTIELADLGARRTIGVWPIADSGALPGCGDDASGLTAMIQTQLRARMGDRVLAERVPRTAGTDDEVAARTELAREQSLGAWVVGHTTRIGRDLVVRLEVVPVGRRPRPAGVLVLPLDSRISREACREPPAEAIIRSALVPGWGQLHQSRTSVGATQLSAGLTAAVFSIGALTASAVFHAKYVDWKRGRTRQRACGDLTASPPPDPVTFRACLAAADEEAAGYEADARRWRAAGFVGLGAYVGVVVWSVLDAWLAGDDESSLTPDVAIGDGAASLAVTGRW